MKLVKLTILIFCLPSLTFAKQKHDKQRHIHKSFEVNTNATLMIDSSYGEINVEVWDKNIVEFDIYIKVSGTDLEKVNKRLKTIKIEFNETRDLVKAKTLIENNTTWINYSLFGKKKFLTNRIFYNIKIPESMNLKLNNTYGKVTLLSDINGTTSINCKYSDFFASSLNNLSNKIKLMYAGGSRIFYMKSGEINAMYSEIEIEKSGNLVLETKYTNVDIQKVNTINFDMDYGDLSIYEVHKINGSGDYTDIRIGTVYNLNIDTDYGNLRVNNFKGVGDSTVDSDYANVRIGGTKKHPFNFNVRTTFSKFNYPKDLVKVNKKDKNGQRNSYKGFFHKKGKYLLHINSDYGNVSFKNSY